MIPEAFSGQQRRTRCGRIDDVRSEPGRRADHSAVSPTLRASPLCRATTGYFLQEFYSLPNYPGYSANPVEAFSSVPPEGLLQIVFFMGWLEVTANKGKYTMMNMFEDGRTPGDLGFDPLKFGENKATRERLEMAELKNGRLAMIAFSGMLHQTFVTGKPLWASVQEIFATPSGGLA